MDAKVRAYVVPTGQEKWSHDLPGNGQSTPMSFVEPGTGRQMVIVTVHIASWGYPQDAVTNNYPDSQTKPDSKGGYMIAFAMGSSMWLCNLAAFVDRRSGDLGP